MSAHTKMRLTEQQPHIICIQYAGAFYELPMEIAKKYRVNTSVRQSAKKNITEEDLFRDINKKYTKAGALFGGLRFRENLTQVEMAKKLKVTQSDISQMEHGKRKIGLKMARRIAKLFNVDCQSFMSV
jgi:DNA-binding XRE family transcriptional regulator